MTLRIITGTIVDAKDTFGKMAELVDKNVFTKWILTEEGKIPMKPTSISVVNDLKFSIIQTTGSGKTILGVLYSYLSKANGINIGGNLSLKWTDNNKGKNKEKWQPIINCMEDLESAKFMHILLDDVRSTISSWNTKDAKMVSEVANATRKKGNWIDITTQRIENFIPPDLKLISDEIIVPYIRVVDKTQPSPDGRGKPLQIMALRFSPGYDFLDYKVYNFNTKVGDEILGGYDTLQLAVGLKDGIGGARVDQEGYQLECDIKDEISTMIPTVEVTHLNGKDPFDLIFGNKLAFDVKKNTNGLLQTSGEGDTWTFKLHEAKTKGWNPYIVYKRSDGIFATFIKRDLPTKTDIDLGGSLMFRRQIPIEKLLKRIFPNEFIES